MITNGFMLQSAFLANISSSASKYTITMTEFKYFKYIFHLFNDPVVWIFVLKLHFCTGSESFY